jgi:hypothetical protein
MRHGPNWLRSCSYCRHNSVCGERELRGERRRKGGRTWATTAASSFFVCLVSAAGVAAQGLSVEPRAGVVVSSGLYADAVIEGFAPVEVAPGPAFEAGLIARTPLSPLWAVEVELTYATGSLEADGDGASRRLSDLKVVGGAVRVRRAWRGIEGVAGVGGLSYDAPDARAYAEDSSVFPSGVLGLAVPFAVAGQRLRVEATARVHRHQTPVLDDAGADAAFVVRGGIQAGIEIGGAR